MSRHCIATEKATQSQITQFYDSAVGDEYVGRFDVFIVGYFVVYNEHGNN